MFRAQEAIPFRIYCRNIHFRFGVRRIDLDQSPHRVKMCETFPNHFRDYSKSYINIYITYFNLKLIIKCPF